MIVDDELVSKGVAGLGGLFVAGRMLLSWLRKSNSTDTLTSERDKYMADLKSDLDKWEERHNALLRNHAEMAELISELKMQNRLLRVLVRAKGLTDEDLRDAGIEP